MIIPDERRFQLVYSLNCHAKSIHAVVADRDGETSGINIASRT